MALEPITRAEQIMSGKNLEPVTREEIFLAKLGGANVNTPTPITRKEQFLQKAIEGGTGGVNGWLVLSGQCTEVGDYAFKNSPLVTVNLPNATSIGVEAFYYCNKLTSIDIPVATIIDESALNRCAKLTSVDLPMATSIGAFAFYRCTNLSAVILRNAETVCNVIITAFLGTKIATEEGAPAGEGFIYVPSALFEDYVANVVMQITVGLGQDEATAEYIARAVLRKIEDYPEICG